MIPFLVLLVRELLSHFMTMPKEVGRVSSGTTSLDATRRDEILRRAKAAGLLSVLVFVVSCGQTEIVVSRLFPLSDWPAGFPILAQGSARIMLQDGTVGELKDAGGLMLLHPADVKTLIQGLESRPNVR